MERFKRNLCLLDFLKHFRSVRAVEWGTARQHLVDHAPKAPPVARLTVGSIFLHDFGRQVFGCAAQTFCALGIRHVFLGQAEVGKKRKAMFVYQHVFGFQTISN